MKHHYADIRDFIDREPDWFDEHGAPRYTPFDPNLTADIYASETCLLLVECQNCGRPFKVSLSWSRWEGFGAHPRASLTERAQTNSLEYNDPPNVECCPSGPTMNSVPRAVLEFWVKPRPINEWTRVPDLEQPIDCEWMRDS